MNKTAIKNFAIWARNKLIADVSYRAGLMGITESGIADPLPQSTGDFQFFAIGAAEPYAISEEAIRQRSRLVSVIRQREEGSDYQTAYQYIIEEVAYTWFNRLIAVRFMEVNDYLPSHIRVLSSESGKLEPDLVTTPFDADLFFTAAEEARIIQLKQENKLDEAFRILFMKQCNALNEILPALFEQTSDYTELLLNLSVIDQDGVVYHLIHDIPEDDFNVEQGGQVEIIGWLYQYYNTDLNNQVYDGNMSKSRVPKELLPAATTIYTPDWAIRYMVENSLGCLWAEGHPDSNLKQNWKYYLEEAEQEPEVQSKIAELRREYAALTPEDLRFIDPCMGSGHILVYAFDVLMQIYESAGYSQRDAAKSILEHNLYGLDIDDRAYQLAYFAVMMKARQYNRRILNGETACHVYAIQESNGVNRAQLQYFGAGLNDSEKNTAKMHLVGLLDTLTDAKEYGSILNVENYDWDLLRRFVSHTNAGGQISMDSYGLEETAEQMERLIEIGETMARKYHVTCTNPPYLGSSRFSPKLEKYVKDNYADVKSDLSMVMYKHAIDNMTKKNGYIAFITTSSWMFLSSFEKIRSYIFKNASISTLVDFGTELFEGKVGHNPIVSWITYNAQIDYRMSAIRLVDYCYSRRDEKESEFFELRNRYTAQQDNFSKIPGSPVAYWVSEAVYKAFSGSSLEGFAPPRAGLSTGDNERFLRTFWEVEYSRIYFVGRDRDDLKELHDGRKWVPHAKGGDFRKWYGNNGYVLNFEKDGEELKYWLVHNPNDPKTASYSRYIRNYEWYLHSGFSFNDVSSGRTAFRFQPNGFIPNARGPFIYSDDYNLLGYLNSTVCAFFLNIIAPTLTYNVGDVKKVPYHSVDKDLIVYIVKESVNFSREDWDSFETSWDFSRHPLFRPLSLLSDAYAQWEQECTDRFNQLKANEEELNRIFIDIYGLQDELTPEVADKDVTVRRLFPTKEEIPQEMRGSSYALTCADAIKSLLSYAVGCMFGRYSLDMDGLAYAGGEWDSSKYKIFVPDADNVLPITDEEYLEDDIVARLCTWLKAVYGADTLEENLDFIAKALGNKGDSSRAIIRNYFLNDFFKDHCQTYSVTGSGKRPIYWLFDSGKQNGFKALIYLHRYTPDTIGTLRVDYLHRMQRVYEAEIGRMQDMIDHSQNPREVAAATKRRDKLAKQLKECRDYDEKISHLALSRIELDLDDGVKVNYRKAQTAYDGKFYEVLADSKNIMAKQRGE